jgi:hypothetical protein
MPDHVEHKAVLWQANINAKQQKKLDVLFETGTDLHILSYECRSFLVQRKGCRVCVQISILS